MDSAQWSKIVASALGVAAMTTLALAGKISGEAAAQAIEVIVSAFIGGTAVLGGAKAIAAAMKR